MWLADQWNRKDNPEMGPHKYAQLVFEKDTKAIQWRKVSFQQREHLLKMNHDLNGIPFTQNLTQNGSQI